MADRRVTQVLTEVEYATPTNVRCVDQILTEVEYAPITNFRTITQVLVMVEYRGSWPVPGRKGPPTQLI